MNYDIVSGCIGIISSQQLTLNYSVFRLLVNSQQSTVNSQQSTITDGVTGIDMTSEWGACLQLHSVLKQG
ncbi:hypothetical protein QUA56_14195 [Microcoleus sp. N3A4]|uniref:hypothetical protein n=1 Tax=Microcoleus sp. N3A4 TaxID=3055379 RepID=UPI002FCEF6C7